MSEQNTNQKTTALLIAFARLTFTDRTDFIINMNRFIFASPSSKRHMLDEWTASQSELEQQTEMLDGSS